MDEYPFQNDIIPNRRKISDQFYPMLAVTEPAYLHSRFLCAARLLKMPFAINRAEKHLPNVSITCRGVFQQSFSVWRKRNIASRTDPSGAKPFQLCLFTRRTIIVCPIVDSPFQQQCLVR